MNSMEEDINENIKILEESIIQGKYHLYKKDLKKFVSNVIKAYKELEEENRYLKTHIIYPEIIKLNFIPVSLVGETIEELNKKEKQELKGLKGQDRYFVKQIYQYKRSVLQELLEKRK